VGEAWQKCVLGFDGKSGGKGSLEIPRFWWEGYFKIYFDVLLTVHLSVILVHDKLDAQFLYFYNT